jgi:hypothetical protein
MFAKGRMFDMPGLEDVRKTMKIQGRFVGKTVESLI